MTSILIVGSSGHAKVVVDIVHNEGRFKIVGLVDSFSVVGESAVGYSVLGGEQDIGRIADSRHLAGYLIAVGDNFARAGIAERISVIAPGLPLVSAVHPRAVLAESVYVGAGTVVMAGAVVNPGAIVGRCCIINTNASLDHDAKMEDYSSLAPGVAIGGNSTIGSFSAIGIGATVVHRVRIGSHVVVGAGAAVVQNVDDHLLVTGVPARPLRMREVGEKYL